MNRFHREFWSVAVSGALALGALCNEAWAQTAQTAQAPAESGVLGAKASDALAEITVTATKVETTLQRTAAAITVVSADQMISQGVIDLRQAQNLVPSVRFQAEGASTEIYIRGVGSTVDLPNIEPPTAVNFNGSYVPREATSVGFFDVAQLEVLPGPQGTLYGRNALGGTVNVTFNRPTQELGGSALVEIGNYSMYHGTVVENIPITDQFAVRAAVDYITNNGYESSGAESRNDYSARLSGLYDNKSNLTIYAWGSFAEKNGYPANTISKGKNGGTGSGDPNAYETKNPWDDLADGAPGHLHGDYKNAVLGGELDWRIGDMTLTYIPSYLYLNWATNYYLEGFQGFLGGNYNQVTQELRLAGHANKLSWLAGLYYYNTRNAGLYTVGPFSVTDVTANLQEGAAAFGQVSYSVTDTFRVIAGGRFSHDERKGEGITALGSGGAGGAVGGIYTANRDFNHTDWKVGLEYDVLSRSMLYATVQTAYAPGTYNQYNATPTQDNFTPQSILTAYVLGVKSRFWDQRLQINNEMFYYDYGNFSVTAENLATGLQTSFDSQKVKVYGDQLDMLLQATSDDRLNISAGYLHGRYSTFLIPGDVNLGTGRTDYSGYVLQNSPEWTVSAGAQHDFHLTQGGYVRVRADTRYEEAYWGTFLQLRGTRQIPYFKTDASLTYFSQDGRWSAGLWIKNVDNTPVQSAEAGGFGPWGDGFLEEPRTYGFRGMFSW